jgi:hypothetical protein
MKDTRWLSEYRQGTGTYVATYDAAVYRVIME